MIDSKLLDFIVCPVCKSDLKERGGNLFCSRCNKDYQVIEGIPILLEGEVYEEDMKITAKTWEKKYEDNKDKYDPENPPEEVKSSSGYAKKYFDIDSKKGVWFEVGCGTARTSLEISKQENLTIICLDISISGLLAAKTLFKENRGKAFFICGDMKKMPIKNDKIDFIFSDGAIEHFRDTRKVISEFWRVTKKGGLVFATVPYAAITMLTYGQRQGNIPNLPGLRKLFEFIHIQVLSQKLMKNGYELSFTRSKLKSLFDDFSHSETGHYDAFNEITFFKNQGLKRMFRRVSRMKPFWPLIFVYAKK